MPDSINLPNMNLQKTLKSSVNCNGVGLHSGNCEHEDSACKS